VCAALFLVVCTAACSLAPTAPGTPVPITSFRMVAGNWGGVIQGLASPVNDEGDWVKVTIGEDGTSDFGIYRTIGVFSGKGKLTLADGKLTGQGPRGQVTYTLIERGGQQYLRVAGKLEGGTDVSGDLHRVQ
jgi:hypothetical protein